jgi:hypothetical protein
MSALVQKQTFAPQKVMSALPPKADIDAMQPRCPLRANSGHHLLKYVICPRRQTGWHGDVEASRSFQIYYEFKLGRLHDWQIRGAFAFEDTGNKSTGLPERVLQIGPVTHQAAFFGKLPPFINRGYPELHRRIDKQRTPTEKIGIGTDKHCASMLLPECLKGIGDFILFACAFDLNFYAKCTRRIFKSFN